MCHVIGSVIPGQAQRTSPRDSPGQNSWRKTSICHFAVAFRRFKVTPPKSDQAQNPAIKLGVARDRQNKLTPTLKGWVERSSAKCQVSLHEDWQVNKGHDVRHRGQFHRCSDLIGIRSPHQFAASLGPALPFLFTWRAFLLVARFKLP